MADEEGLDHRRITFSQFCDWYYSVDRILKSLHKPDELRHALFADHPLLGLIPKAAA